MTDTCPCGKPSTGLGWKVPRDPYAPNIKVCSKRCQERVMELRGNVPMKEMTR